MVREVAAIIGSGSIPFTYGILDPSQRGNLVGGEGVRIGSQVILANPEDLLAVDAFAASGVTVGTTAVEIIGPHNNPLPRCTSVKLRNDGTNDVFISHKQSFPTLDAFIIPAADILAAGTGSTDPAHIIELPILHNVSVWAKTATGTSIVRLLIY